MGNINITLIGVDKNILRGKNQFHYTKQLPQNQISHLFLVHDHFIISKFLYAYLNKYPVLDFDYPLFAKTQIDLLGHLEHFSSYHDFDLTESKIEEVLAVIIFWEILQNYTQLLGIDSFYNIPLRIKGQESIIQKYKEMKKNLTPDLDFLTTREELLWKQTDIIGGNHPLTLKERYQKSPTKQIQWENEYKPQRGLIRFFLYSFFGFEMFSEERQDSVNLGKIFTPETTHAQLTIEEGNQDYTSEEGGQYNIIANILLKKNTLGLLSTGSGKSITFLLTGMLQPGTCFVVAPLKSLIEDQWFNLETNFFLYDLTGRIHSGLGSDEKKQTMNKLLLGDYKFLYCAPERLQIKKFVDAIQKVGLNPHNDPQDRFHYIQSLLESEKVFLTPAEIEKLKNSRFFINEIVIDEAHCLSEWGHDFRFSYLNIKRFTEYLKSPGIKIPLIGLTATASDIVRNDIIKYLNIQHIVKESTLNRPNLSMEIIFVDESLQKTNTIKTLLQEKIDNTLTHIGNLKQKIHHPISYKDPEFGYQNAGIIFTIYGPIGSKSAEESVQQTAERLERHLSENCIDPNYIQHYFSESPQATVEACPICSNLDLIHIETNATGKLKKLYYNPVEEKYITYGQLEALPYQLKQLCEKNEIKNPNNSPYWACNNSSCKWLSFESENQDEQKPLTIYLIEPAELKEQDIKQWWEKKKNELQTEFKENKVGLLIATKGFGMGIDKKNIRYVIHATLSGSLEAYYQEIGRAGRDKQHSHCILLFSPPLPECIKDTNNFEAHQTPPCMKDPECMQYLKCPLKDGMKFCDIARQRKMMSSPIIIEKGKKKLFLHDVINSSDFLHSLDRAEILQTKINIKSILLKEIASSFSHPLVEFFQLYFFFHETIKKAEIINQNGEHKLTFSTNGESSGYEKLIFRLMSMGCFSHYFKEYQKSSSVVFHIYLPKENSDLPGQYISQLDYYLKHTLHIEDNAKKRAFGIGLTSYPNFQERILDQDQFTQDLWILIYHIYDKVENQRHEMLKNLYRAIKESQNGCFRQKILGRLTEFDSRDESGNLEKCGFCSGCHHNMLDISKPAGLLKKDFEIKAVNNAIKKSLQGESLSQEEQILIQSYNLKEDLKTQIRKIFSEIERQGLEKIDELLPLLDENKFDITPMIQRKLETGIQNPRYFLLSAYFIPEDRHSNIQSIISYYDGQEDSNEFLSIAQWLNKDPNSIKKEIQSLLLADENPKLSVLKLEIYRITYNLSESQIQLLLTLPKLLSNSPISMESNREEVDLRNIQTTSGMKKSKKINNRKTTRK